MEIRLGRPSRGWSRDTAAAIPPCEMAVISADAWRNRYAGLQARCRISKIVAGRAPGSLPADPWSRGTHNWDTDREVELLVHHADDRAAEAVEFDGLAHERAIRAVAPLPEAVAEHDGLVLGPASRFFRQERRGRAWAWRRAVRRNSPAARAAMISRSGSPVPVRLASSHSYGESDGEGSALALPIESSWRARRWSSWRFDGARVPSARPDFPGWAGLPV
jgi:hypothetical protein